MPSKRCAPKFGMLPTSLFREKMPHAVIEIRKSLQFEESRKGPKPNTAATWKKDHKSEGCIDQITSPPIAFGAMDKKIY